MVAHPETAVTVSKTVTYVMARIIGSSFNVASEMPASLSPASAGLNTKLMGRANSPASGSGQSSTRTPTVTPSTTGTTPRESADATSARALSLCLSETAAGRTKDARRSGVAAG
jgi:hypothetical protein